MINVVSLMKFLSRLFEYLVAKYQIWILRPFRYIFITPIRTVVEFIKVLILGLYSAALTHSADQQNADADMLFSATDTQHNVALFLLSLAKYKTAAPGSEVLNLIIRADRGAPIGQIPQLARLSGLLINTRIIIHSSDSELETAPHPPLTADTTSPALFNASMEDFLRTGGTKRFRVPLVYRNDAHKFCKVIVPNAATCYIAISPLMLSTMVFDNLHKIFSAHPNWHFLIAGDDAHFGDDAQQWALNVTRLASLSMPPLTQLALINESDVFIGGDDVFGIYAVDQAVDAHLFVPKIVQGTVNKSLTLHVIEQIKPATEFPRIVAEVLSQAKSRT